MYICWDILYTYDIVWLDKDHCFRSALTPLLAFKIYPYFKNDIIFLIASILWWKYYEWSKPSLVFLTWHLKGVLWIRFPGDLSRHLGWIMYSTVRFLPNIGLNYIIRSGICFCYNIILNKASYLKYQIVSYHHYKLKQCEKALTCPWKKLMPCYIIVIAYELIRHMDC